MKKILSLLLTAIIPVTSLLLLNTVSASESEKLLTSSAVILIPENATVQETAAAERLQELIAEISGVSHEIVTSNPNDFYEISVGETGRVEADFSGKLDGSYIIKSYDNGVAIVGTPNRGNIWGVYEFIRRYGGGIYYISAEMAKTRSSILLPENADASYFPVLEYTETDWVSPHDVSYSLANGLNGTIYRDIPDEYGGMVGYIGNFAHTLTKDFCSKDVYFETHPEYFAERNGVRVPDQLCLTNESVYNIVKEEVFDLLKREHNPEATLQIISLTQYDNTNYCTCESCSALDEANGSPSGSNITFVNKIAEDVEKAGYDNVAIDTFAYQYTRSAPTNVVPRDNVIVRFCTLEACFTHPLDSTLCSSNKRVFGDFKDWSKICDNLYVWDYTSNFWHTLGIFPDFDVLQTNMQLFVENGVKGIYEEGNYFMPTCDTEFGELRAYLICKLMQNPYCDYEQEMNNFLAYYYGDAGEYIKKFIDKTSKVAARTHSKISTEMSEVFIFLPGEISACNKLWKKAKDAVKEDNENYLERVERSELSWRFVKASVNGGEFNGIFSGIEARKELRADLEKSVTMTSASNPLVFNDDYIYLPAKYWFKTDYEGFDLFLKNLIIFYVNFIEMFK